MEQPKSDKKWVKPEAIFQQAESFTESATLLGRTAELGSPQFFFPSIVCDAFGLELYLKCLILVEGDKYSGTHNLELLFNKLTPESQMAIRNACAPVVAKMHEMHQALPREKGAQPLPVLDFDYALRASRNAFEVFRYVHERDEDNRNGDGWFGREIAKRTRERILFLQPDWWTIVFRFTDDPKAPKT
jgi:hypothetical protein